MGTIKVIKKFIESNSVIERTVREVLERLPVRFRYGISYGPTFRYWLGFLRESEKWSRDRIEAYQVEQLKDILIHSGKNVPYYKRIFKEYGFGPEKLQSLDDMKSLPYTDKEMVRDNINDFISANIPKKSLFKKNTSGSTGIPLSIYSDKEAEEKHWATVVHAWSKVGYSPKSKIALFWNSSQKVKRYGNQLILSRFYFDDESLQERFVALIRKFEPEFVLGIPSALLLFSNFMKERKIAPFEGIKTCIVESEPLYRWQREPIEEMFNARTFSTYGMVEKAVYASQCRGSSLYHVYPQYGIPETVSAGNGIYEIAGTSLVNYANPLIRYRTSDIGVLDTNECPHCKYSYQSLVLTVGRVGSLLVGRNGKIYSPLMAGVDSDVFGQVKIFQFYQETPGNVILRIVKKQSFTEFDIKRIRKRIIRDLGLEGEENNMELEIAAVRDIHKEPSGKFNMVQQMLDVEEFIFKRRRDNSESC